MSREERWALGIMPPYRRRTLHPDWQYQQQRWDSFAPPTEGQRNLALTGLALGAFSIITAFFPPCGLPIAVTGLLMGVLTRRFHALRTITFWGIILACIGLVLALVNIVVSVSIYFSTYLWQ